MTWLYSGTTGWTNITNEYNSGHKIRHPDLLIGRQLKKRSPDGLEPSWVIDRKFQDQANNLKLLAAAEAAKAQAASAEEAKAQAARALSGFWGGSSGGSAMAGGSASAGAAP